MILQHEPILALDPSPYDVFRKSLVQALFLAMFIREKLLRENTSAIIHPQLVDPRTCLSWLSCLGRIQQYRRKNKVEEAEEMKDCTE